MASRIKYYVIFISNLSTSLYIVRSFYYLVKSNLLFCLNYILEFNYDHSYGWKKPSLN